MNNIEKEILKVLKDLLNYKSISSDIKSLKGIVDYVKQYFHGHKFVQIIENNNKPSIIISNFDGISADIMLNGHLDVVPVSSEKEFEIYEQEGKIFGRGTGDMKSGVAIIMVLMKKLLEKNYNQKKIMLVLSTDEEIGGFDGVKYLVDKGYFGKYVLIPDAGSIDRVIYAEKGVYQITIKSTGKSCHSSTPWKGENAIMNIINFYNDLKNELQDTQRLYHGDNRSSSVNLNVINGGVATNVIPDSAQASIDVRFTHKRKDVNNINEIVNKYLSKNNCSIVKLVTGSILFTDINDKNIQLYLNISKSIVGDGVFFDKAHGASDGRFFSEVGSKVLLHRPRLGNIHGDGEYSVIEDFKIIYNVFEQFILNSKI